MSVIDSNMTALRVRWTGITALIANGGHVTIGRVAHVEGAAIAADEHTVFATVVRRRDESFEELLGRLDQAVSRALYEGIRTNELEDGQFMIAQPARRGSPRPKRRQ